MNNRLYAMLPEAAMEWEQRRVSALAKIPRAELSEESKDEITAFMEMNREYIKQYLSMFYNQRREMKVSNGVAIIHANDFLGGGLTFFDKCLGGSDYSEIAADIKSARENPEVKAAMLDCDSGGGSALGCVEVGRLWSELSAEKETAFYSGSMCCSAMYAIAVGSRQRYASPSALVGSIGTIMSFMDYARMLEDMGIAPHIITSTGADLKASMNALRTPTNAETNHLQEMADEYASQFISHVWENNQGIDAEQGFRGQAVSGREAVSMGYIDAVSTREEVLERLESWAAVS